MTVVRFISEIVETPRLILPIVGICKQICLDLQKIKRYIARCNLIILYVYYVIKYFLSSRGFSIPYTYTVPTQPFNFALVLLDN